MSAFPRLFALGLLVLLMLVSTLPAAAQSDDDLRRQLRALEDRQQELSGQLQEATAQVDALQAELAVLQQQAQELVDEIGRLEAASAEGREQLRLRLRQLYKGTASSELVGLLSGSSVADVTNRSHYLRVLSAGEQEGLERLAATTVALQRRRDDLATTRAEIARVTAEAQQAQETLNQRLAEAGQQVEATRAEIVRREEEARRRAEEERRRRAAAEAEARRERELASRAQQPRAAAEQAATPARQERARQEASPPRQQQPVRSAPAAPASGRMACPQDHPRSFTDTWGAPRSGGRRHQGTDIFGAHGGNVFAITDGVIQWTRTGNNAGLWLSLRGNDGHSYWYMHLSGFVAKAGQRVRAGELIAYNGNTGNARGTSPHIHFEYHPGGGGAVNPYPLLRRVCG